MNISKSQNKGKFDGWHAVFTGAIVLLIGWLGSLGFFSPLDNTLRDMRFKFDNRAVTGEVVLVEIDPKSLAHFGVWPWPRSLHAQAIDALVEYGAYNIALDIDFSSHSNPESDAAMAKALDDAGGFVILASFAQQSGSDGQVSFNRPIEEFAKNSWPASVNVAVDEDGRVREFPYSSLIEGQRILSFPAAISSVESGDSAGFLIDYSIDAFGVDRVSFLDVINKTVAPERLANKNVIIGAGAVELRDNFAVSRYGVISGPMLQVLATETLMQGRQLKSPANTYSLLIVGLMGILFMLMFKRMSVIQISAGVVVSVLATEYAGFYAQSQFGLLYKTAIIHGAYFSFLLGALGFELERRLGLFKKASQEKEVTQAILNQVITDNFDGVVVVDETLQIRMASGFAEEILNPRKITQLVGGDAKVRLPETFWRCIAATLDEHQQKSDGLNSVRSTSFVLENGEQAYFEYVVTRSTIDKVLETSGVKSDAQSGKVVACLTFRDVTERKKNAEKIKFIAHHDGLTGAFWRVKFAEEVSEQTSSDMGLEQGINVGALDLRRFKQVNETLGHAVGDQLVVQAVERMRVGNVAHVGRLGGHSFIFSTKEALSGKELDEFCEDMIARLCEPYHLGEHRVIIGVSIGVTDSFISGPLPDILLAHADMALTSAGASSRTSYCVYTHELEEELLRKQDVESALRSAIENEEFWVAYQPQVELSSGDLIGVEALIRWNHPEWGFVGPDQFIPVAEETGLIVEIGQWIMERACLEAAAWPVPINLAVNVSPLQFEFSDVGAGVQRALEKSGLDPALLDVEITESNFVEQSQDIIDKLEGIRAKGIGVALDDFGTGFSSLSYLTRLPIDKIKVDQSFVRGLPEDRETLAIVQSILTLGTALEKTIVAEGIETQEQADILNLGGADIGQGYFFGKPMNDADMRGFLLKQFWQEPEKTRIG